VWLERYVLKGRHFPKESDERQQAHMVSLLVYLPGLALVFDLLESYEHHHATMIKIESSILVILVLITALFPKFLKLFYAIIMILALYTLYLFITLYIPDKNAEISLFWFAALPIGVYYFLGADKGIHYTLLVIALLLGVLLLSYLNIRKPIYDTSMILQLLYGFMAISYVLYVIEEKRKESEEKLKTLLENNKILFKEMHHRTKNNMQVMMGLLETQSFKIEDPKCQKMLLAHIDRIKAMAYVHENLYTGASVDKVDMHKYLGEILKNLQKITKHTILMDIDYIMLDIKQSMSIGLLVNEIVSNAIEHAYSVGSERIDVSLKQYGERCELVIKDYGLGFNTNREYQSLGMTLIHDLSLSLPNGELHIDTAEGTKTTIYFNKEK